MIISNNSTSKTTLDKSFVSFEDRIGVDRRSQSVESERRLVAVRRTIVGLLQWKIIYAFRYQSKQSREYRREGETKPVRGRVNKKKTRSEKRDEREGGRRENDRKGGEGKQRRHEKSGKCSAFTH